MSEWALGSVRLAWSLQAFYTTLRPRCFCCIWNNLLMLMGTQWHPIVFNLPEPKCPSDMAICLFSILGRNIYVSPPFAGLNFGKVDKWIYAGNHSIYMVSPAFRIQMRIFSKCLAIWIKQLSLNPTLYGKKIVISTVWKPLGFALDQPTFHMLRFHFGGGT